MATLSATVRGVTLLSSSPLGVGSSSLGQRKVYLVTCDVPAYASTDNAKIVGIAALVAGRGWTGRGGRGPCR